MAVRSKTGTLIVAAMQVVPGIFMFASPAGAMLSQVAFCRGALILLIGFLLVVRPAMFVAWIFIIAGLGIALLGVSLLGLALAMRGATDMGYAIVPVAVSALTIALGILVVVSPLTLAVFAVGVAGFALVFCGTSKFAEGLTMREA